ncbi:MAG: hypothetical protein Q8O14_05535 [bacterium]|jgi:hypothetical protein|nr:hypothetical protein [bacterium]
MIPCDQVSSELWDWLADPAGHPEGGAIQGHLELCAACRLTADRIASLRASLPGLRQAPDPSFEQDLFSRLESLRANGSDPAADRFEPDAKLEGGAGLAPRGMVVELRHRSWWRRPAALVVAGAAAALVLGLLGRWSGPASPGAGQLANATAEGEAAGPVMLEDSLATTTPTPPQYGVLAERIWEEDSSAAASRRPDHQDRLTPVTTLP